MSAVVFTVRFFLLIYAIPQMSCSESNFEAYNKSRARLLKISEQNMMRYSFYHVEVEDDGKEMKRKYFNLLDKSTYILPEPGCSCVPKMEDCDFECCYCELGCPLVKGIQDGETWLSSMYGNMCEDRRKYGYKAGVAPTFRQRREKSSEKIVLSCDRPNHPTNERMSSFQFICVHTDNSYTSYQYPLRPPSPNLIQLTNVSPMKYSWPILQAFYNNCHHRLEDTHDKTINITEPELLPDERYLLNLRVSQLFHLEPPPVKFIAAGKDQRNSDKLCLSYRRKGAEILGTGRTANGSKEYKHNPGYILEKAIQNLGRRKVNYLVNFQPNPRQPLTNCNQLRHFMSMYARVWIQKIMDFAQGNRSDPTTKIRIKQMEVENLSSDRRWEAGFQNESFPEKCYKVAAGLEVHIYFSWESIKEITHQTFTRDVSASSALFFIQLKSLSPTKMISTRLSRFWTDFVFYECPDQYCWRDIFDFSQLPAQPVVIVATFTCTPIIVLLLFSKVKFYELI